MLCATIWFILLIFFTILFFFTNSNTLYFIPFLIPATTYCVYLATLHEISYDNDFIYIKNIFSNDKKFLRSDFNNISKKFILLNTLTINFNNNQSHKFTPRLKATHFDFSFSAIDEFINYWNNYFKENKS